MCGPFPVPTGAQPQRKTPQSGRLPGANGENVKQHSLLSRDHMSSVGFFTYTPVLILCVCVCQCARVCVVILVVFIHNKKLLYKKLATLWSCVQ